MAVVYENGIYKVVKNGETVDVLEVKTYAGAVSVTSGTTLLAAVPGQRCRIVGGYFVFTGAALIGLLSNSTGIFYANSSGVATLPLQNTEWGVCETFAGEALTIQVLTNTIYLSFRYIQYTP